MTDQYVELSKALDEALEAAGGNTGDRYPSPVEKPYEDAHGEITIAMPVACVKDVFGQSDSSMNATYITNVEQKQAPGEIKVKPPRCYYAVYGSDAWYRLNTLASHTFIAARRWVLESKYEDDRNNLSSSYVHAIPYSAIIQPDLAEGRLFVYVYTRKPGGGESKLAGATSLGYGGHPVVGNLTSDGWLGTINKGTVAEISEEFSPVVAERGKVDAFGAVWDPSNKVGETHLGYFVSYAVPSDHYGFVNEVGHWQCPFTTEEELNPLLGVLSITASGHTDFYPTAQTAGEGFTAETVLGNLENWSKILFHMLLHKIKYDTDVYTNASVEKGDTHVGE